jgi:hypothetical protein
MPRVLRMLFSGTLCAYACYLFVVDLPTKSHVLGPVILVLLAILVAVDPKRIADARERRRTRAATYLKSNQNGSPKDARPMILRRVSLALYAGAVLWIAIAGWHNDRNLFAIFGVPTVLIVAGFALRMYGDASNVLNIYRAAKRERK